MNWEYMIILIGFGTLLLELTCFHVPSVASNVNIIRKKQSVTQLYSERFRGLFQFSFVSRLVFTMVPLFVVYVVFAYPILVIAELIAGPVRPPGVVVWIGCGLIFSGRLMTFSSVLIIRRQNKQLDDSFRLHTDFLFAHSRNPGLLGMYMFMFGIWLVMPSILFFLGIVYYFGYMHFKVLMEEDFLTQKFGESYLNYKTTTGRYWS